MRRISFPLSHRLPPRLSNITSFSVLDCEMLLLNNLFQNALAQSVSLVRLLFFFFLSFFLCRRSNTAAHTTLWTTMLAVFHSNVLSALQRRCSVSNLREDIWRTWELSQPSECSACSESISILIVCEQWWRENVKALRDLGERIWLHLCPIKQLAGSRGMPNIYLYLVASLHLSAYGFMTSKLFWKKKKKKKKKKAPLDRASD